MDNEEARALARKRIEELRQLSYEQLLDFMTGTVVEEPVGASGTRYQLEIEAFWDGGRRATDGHLRVWVAIDDGGWRAFVPLIESFIIAPTGEFIGE